MVQMSAIVHLVCRFSCDSLLNGCIMAKYLQSKHFEIDNTNDWLLLLRVRSMGRLAHCPWSRVRVPGQVNLAIDNQPGTCFIQQTN